MAKKSIYQLVKTFAKEVREFTKHGAPHVNAQQYQGRLKACKSCPHFKPEEERCGLCGCLIEHKAKWGTTTCPDTPQRWDTIIIGEGGKNLNLKDGQESTDTEASN